MSEREQDKNKCSSSGFGLAAAAIGIGVGAAMYYLFSNSSAEASTSSDRSRSYEEPNALTTQEIEHNANIEEEYNSDIHNETNSDISNLVTEIGNASFLSASLNTSIDTSLSDANRSELTDYTESFTFQSDDDDSVAVFANRPVMNDSYFDTPIPIRNKRRVLRHRHTPGEIFRNRSSSLEDCTICFDVMSKDEVLARLPCAHQFHAACLSPWLEQKQTCPNCRKHAG